MNIEYKSKTYKLYRDLSESEKLFNERIKFIKMIDSNKSLSNNINWKTAVKYSKIHINITYLECKYPKYIYLKVKKLTDAYNSS